MVASPETLAGGNLTFINGFRLLCAVTFADIVVLPSYFYFYSLFDLNEWSVLQKTHRRQ